MSYDLLPCKAPSDQSSQQPPPAPTQSSLLEGPPTAGFAPVHSAEKPDPESIAHVLGHYGDDAEQLEPAPRDHNHSKHVHDQKYGQSRKHYDRHHEAKANDKTKDVGSPEIAHTGLGDKIDQLAAKSPTLERELQTLIKSGWKIAYGKEGNGTSSNRGKSTITLDPEKKSNLLAMIRSLSHEAGHALYKPGTPVSMKGLTREQYIEQNVAPKLADEGEATINNLQVREELLKAKQGDIGISGEQKKKYLALYRKYPDAKDRDTLRQEIGKVFAHGEHPSNDSDKTYEQYYAKPFADAWDWAHPPAHK